MDKQIKCIVCPIGCNITVDFNEGTKEIISYCGNECKRGVKFIKEELARPSRLLTTTIKINSDICSRLPVRSDVPVPKEKIQEMIKEAKKIKINAPVKAGQVLAYNFMESGVKILSCSTVSS